MSCLRRIIRHVAKISIYFETTFNVSCIFCIFCKCTQIFQYKRFLTALFTKNTSWFYLNIWIWTVPPVEVMHNWEVQSAIAVVSRPQKANNNIIRFILTILFRGFYHLLIGQRYETKMKNGRNSMTISSILR